MSKVKAVRDRWHGHKDIELEDGTSVVLLRGAAVPKVGSEYPPVKEPPPAQVEDLELSPVQAEDADRTL